MHQSGLVFFIPTIVAVFDGRVAQLVEQVTFNHWVTGSNPVALTILLFVEPYILQQIGGWPYGS